MPIRKLFAYGEGQCHVASTGSIVQNKVENCDGKVPDLGKATGTRHVSRKFDGIILPNLGTISFGIQKYYLYI